MSETHGSAAASLSLPDAANLEWLRKQAKRRLQELRQSNPHAKLAEAQFDLAKQYGFASWRALKAHVDALTIDGQLIDATQRGDVDAMVAILDRYPDKLRARSKPYAFTLLHVAAQNARLAAVDLLLQRGLDVNAREQGDNTYPMHWAAAAGAVDVVRRLADAGGDVVGHGDDHGLEVIGWATCWDGCDDDGHRAVVDLLLSRGAHHTIFSAIAMNRGDDVRRVVARDPSALGQPMSHNEDFQRPLHFAVRKNRPEMLALLFELGADPLATDASGHTAADYATSPDVDRLVLETLRARGALDLAIAVALGDWPAAARFVQEAPALIAPGEANSGALHLMAKRNDLTAAKWLLDHGADPNALWNHWGALVTPLHLAAIQGHADMVRMLLNAGADATIHDSMHDSAPIGWAKVAGRVEVRRILEEAMRP